MFQRMRSVFGHGTPLLFQGSVSDPTVAAAARVSEEITRVVARITESVRTNTFTRSTGEVYDKGYLVKGIDLVVTALCEDRSIAKVGHEIWHTTRDHGLRQDVALLSGLVVQYYGLTYGAYQEKVVEMKHNLRDFATNLRRRVLGVIR